MYDVGSKLVGGITSTYVDRIDSGVRKDCAMSPWLFNVYMDAVKMWDGKEERKWRLPWFL